jgi:hypothetical protein
LLRGCKGKLLFQPAKFYFKKLSGHPFYTTPFSLLNTLLKDLFRRSGVQKYTFTPYFQTLLQSIFSTTPDARPYAPAAAGLYNSIHCFIGEDMLRMKRLVV